MCRFKCEDCHQEIDLKDYWWRHYFDHIEYYCPVCARGHIGIPGDFGLIWRGSPEEVRDDIHDTGRA